MPEDVQDVVPPEKNRQRDADRSGDGDVEGYRDIGGERSDRGNEGAHKKRPESEDSGLKAT